MTYTVYDRIFRLSGAVRPDPEIFRGLPRARRVEAAQQCEAEIGRLLRAYRDASPADAPAAYAAAKDFCPALVLTADERARVDRAYDLRLEGQRTGHALHLRRTRLKAAAVPAPSLAERLAAYRATFRYGIAFPRQKSVRCRFSTLEAAKKAIEGAYAPGYTREPWVQLVAQSPLERRHGTAHVVAEWETARAAWTDPLIAAGFLPRSI